MRRQLCARIFRIKSTISSAKVSSAKTNAPDRTAGKIAYQTTGEDCRTTFLKTANGLMICRYFLVVLAFHCAMAAQHSFAGSEASLQLHYQRSRAMSPWSWLKQINRLPSAGGSTGSGR
jgi:hypothetical protein